MNNKELGRWGEKIAASYLINKDFTILYKNYTSPFGEVDIVAKQNEYTVFIEVKTRRSLAYGLPCEAVDKRKMAKYFKTAMYYIKSKNVDACYRFDVVEVYLKNDGTYHINHIPNAF